MTATQQQLERLATARALRSFVLALPLDIEEAVWHRLMLYFTLFHHDSLARSPSHSRHFMSTCI